MHIPIKVDYGVRALVDLAQHTRDRTVNAEDIARRTSIPKPFLAQVLHTLTKSGVIQSRRGVNGGYSLAMEASSIKLSKVVEYLGHTITPVACLTDSTICIHVPSCAQREVWKSVDKAVFNILDSTTIGSLVEKTITPKTQTRKRP